MKKYIIALFLMCGFTSLQIKAQNVIPNWYLEYSLNIPNASYCTNASYDFPRGYSLLSESSVAKEFLVDKLKEGKYIGKVLQKMGTTKDDYFIEYITPYLSDDDLELNKIAIQALSSIGSTQSIRLLEEELLKTSNTHLYLEIIRSLENNLQPSSIDVLNEFIENKTISVIFKENAQKAISTIRNYTTLDKDGQFDFVYEKLISSDINDWQWAISKFRIFRIDKGLMLSKIKAFIDTKKITPNTPLYNQVIITRLKLGDKKFSDSEKDIIYQRNTRIYDFLNLNDRMLWIQDEIDIMEKKGINNLNVQYDK